MRRKWGLVFTLAVLGGAALHFLYDVWPDPLTAVPRSIFSMTCGQTL